MIRRSDDFRTNFYAVLKPPSRAYGYELIGYTSLSFDCGRYREGQASITLDPRATDVPWDTVLSNLYGWSMDIVRVGGALPLWWGPVVKTTYDHQYGSRITLDCESFEHHLARRRLALSNTNAQISDGVTQTYAGVVINQLMTSAWANPATVSGYPWQSRADSAPWTVAKGSISNGNQIYLQDESGTNLFDMIADLMDRGDLYWRLTESPAGTFTYTVGSPYGGTDRSSTVVFTDLAGNLSAARRFIDFSALSNTFQMRGQGKAASQGIQWYGDSTSKSSYGIFEDGDTAEAINANTTLTSMGSHLAQKDPRITWEIDVDAMDEFPFDGAFEHRDIISFHHSEMTQHGLGSAVAARVIGYRCDFEQGDTRWTFELGDPARNFLGELYQVTGTPGGRRSGYTLVTKGGW